MVSADTEQKKQRGGARKGSGMKKGHKTKKTLEKELVMEALRKQVYKVVPRLIEAQIVEGVGYYQMMKVEKIAGKVQYTRVTDKKEFETLISEGRAGEDYIIVARQDPNHKASDAVLNRALGKPTESIELGNLDGQPFIIKLDT